MKINKKAMGDQEQWKDQDEQKKQCTEKIFHINYFKKKVGFSFFKV